MKFTAIAVASVALVGSVVTAAPFSWGCNYPIHFFGASGIKPDITVMMSYWNNNITVSKNYEAYGYGTYLKVTCKVNDDTASSFEQKDCRGALSWLWNSVTAKNSQWMDKTRYVPESCWVQNGAALIKWQRK